jgi:alditol oxidase
MSPLTNWAGNVRYSAAALVRPRTLTELQRLVTGTAAIRILNTGHTFNAIADCEMLIGLDQLEGACAIDVDLDSMSVAVGPTVTYAQLAVALQQEQLALENMASLPHISVTGGIATGTHGSGDRLGNLATSVRAVRLLTSDGDQIEISTSDPRFPGAVIHLGALGVVVGVTLAVQPSYQLRQDVYLNMEWPVLAENFDAISSAGRSVSVFHDFGDRTREVWVKRDPHAEFGHGSDLFGAVAATNGRNPLPGGDPANCTPQLGVPGPWHERLPHFRSGFFPSAGDEIQSEWFVAREDAMTAIQALRELADVIQPVLYIAELRTIAADELWLSGQYRRNSVGLHFTWRRQPEAVASACAAVERTLAHFSPRAHWGKVFGLGASAIAESYPRLPDFLSLREELDPGGKFLNRWLRDRLLGAGTPCDPGGSRVAG